MFRNLPASPAGPEVSRARRLWPSLLVLVLGLLATGLATHRVRREAMAESRLEFDFVAQAVGLKVQERLQALEQVLRGGAGLMAAADQVTRAQWRTFVSTLRMEQQLPGVLGVGYAVLVRPAELDEHLRSVRAEGFPNYRVWPEDAREVYSSIVYLEPFTNRNLRAFGYDMLTEPTRREALERARDEDTAALTGKVKLVQETATDVQAGTLMFVPVYHRGLPVGTAAERRAALRGWVYSPYRMNDLMEGILTTWDFPRGKQIRVRLYDGDVLVSTNLLYDSQQRGTNPPSGDLNGQLTFCSAISCAGRSWTLELSEDPGPAHHTANRRAGEVAGVGAVLSLLLAGLIHTLRHTRWSARRLAAKLTADLQQTTERLALATDAGQVGIWDYDVVEDRLIWDAQMFRLYGITSAEFTGAYAAWQAGVHPDDRQRGDAEIQQALRGEREFQTEFRVCWPGGQVRHIRAMSRVQRDAKGRPLRMIGTNWDITERKQAEGELRSKTALLEAQANATIDGMLVVDQQGRQILRNQRFLELFQIPTTLLADQDDEASLRHSVGLVKDPEAFLAKIRALNEHPEEVSRDEVVFQDGTILDRYSAPVTGQDGLRYGRIWTFRDITERKRVEEALRESQFFLEETQRVARLAGWKANPHTDYLEWTSGVFEIIEAPPTQQPGLADGLKFYLPEYIPILRECITRCLETGERFAVECQGTTGSGRVIWTEVRGLAPVVNGGRSYVLGAFQDITARKQAEQALRESEANFRTFFESMTDMIMVGSLDGRMQFTNAAVSRTLGYTPEELSSMHILTLHPVDRREEAEVIFTAMFRGERETCPLPLARKDGSLVPVETRVWFGRWNGAQCIFGISKNLTAEVEAQQRFERLFRSNPAVMAISTLPDRRFFDVNHAFVTTLGYTRAEVLGHTAAELNLFMHPEHAVQIGDQIQVQGQMSDLEMQVRRKDGAILHGLFSGEVIRSQGQDYFLTVVIDITERKRAEQELLRTLASERELSALKSTFVSMVSHEFRTPLSAILGATEMLEDFYDRLPEEKRQSYFGMIRRETQRLNSMLQDVLLHGQLAAGRIQLHPRPTDVSALCREVIASVEGAFPGRLPVLFVTEAPTARTMMDGSLLERMLTNLLTNAFKYSPAPAPVRLGLRRVQDDWEFKVQDEGIGIPVADQAAIFSAFRRGSNVGAIKGTGVGLYIVKKCAELHGGRVELQSQPGQGSTFLLFLPWQPVPETPP